MDGFQKRSELKKDKIKQTTIELLKKYPPKKVSIRDIASAADVSMVTIYNYFKNKDGLLLEIIRDLVEDQLDNSKSIIYGEESFLEKVQKLMNEKSNVLSAFHEEFITYVMKEEEIKHYLENVHIKESSVLIEEFIQMGVEQGYIDSAIPTSLIKSVIELYRRDLQSDDGILANYHDFHQLNNHLINIIIFGISGKK
ncbi:TetR/AcrR family transcriptional regulator [Halobacillus sp. K22]|uniref:TetR/AcrR family transcriptional regulator n=1 Tax=Halobacillus sp. K22 TaxID=3457431 RepID=UPI003FCC4719